MKCKKCGAEISESNKFCGICGAANSDNTAEGNAFPDVTVSNVDTEDKNDEIDDILNKYGKGFEESGEDETPVFESAERESSEGEKDKMNSENSEHLQQGENTQSSQSPNTQGSNAQSNNYQAGANPQYGGGNPNMPYNGYPPQNGYYIPYGGYPQPPFAAPYPQPFPQNSGDDAKNKNGKKTKEKRVVSLGIAVFCVIMVLILSAACGYLTETCFRHGINPLNPNKTGSIVLISENNIGEGVQNG